MRLAIAGADVDTVLTVPESGPTPVANVYRGGKHASRMELPVVRDA